MVRGGAELSAQFPAQRQLDKGTGRSETLQVSARVEVRKGGSF